MISHLTPVQQGYIAAGLLLVAAILLLTALAWRVFCTDDQPEPPPAADRWDDTAVIYTVGRHRPEHVREHKADASYLPLYSPAFAAVLGYPPAPRPSDVTEVLPVVREVTR